MTPSKIFVRCFATARWGVALVGLLAVGSVHAAQFCVSDATTLTVALVQASLSVASSNVIKLQQGNYLMAATVNYDFPRPIYFEGGYSANCASRAVNPANTVIDIGIGHGFQLRQLAASPQALISVDGVTFSHTNNGLFIQAGQYGDFSNDAGSVIFSRARFTNISTGGATTPVWLIAFNNGITLDNVLIDHVSTTSACGFTLRGEGGVSMRLNHVTADLAGGDDFCFDDDIDQGV